MNNQGIGGLGQGDLNFGSSRLIRRKENRIQSVISNDLNNDYDDYQDDEEEDVEKEPRVTYRPYGNKLIARLPTQKEELNKFQ